VRFEIRSTGDRSRIERNETNTNCTNFEEFDRETGVSGEEVISSILNRIVRTEVREGKGENRKSELSRTCWKWYECACDRGI
jgi:hypothetical protein